MATDVLYIAAGAVVGTTEGLIHALLTITQSSVQNAWARYNLMNTLKNTVSLFKWRPKVERTDSRPSKAFADPEVATVVPVVVLGGPGVGKTTLILNYLSLEPPTVLPCPTVGADLFTQTITVGTAQEPSKILLQIWDVGSGYGRMLGTAFYREARGAMLVINPHDAQCFSNLLFWHHELVTRAGVEGDCFPIVVVANQHDSSSPTTTSTPSAFSPHADSASAAEWSHLGLPETLDDEPDTLAGRMQRVSEWCAGQERVILFELHNLDDVEQLEAAFLHLASAAAAYTAGKAEEAAEPLAQ